jgi:hypothetical protein
MLPSNYSREGEREGKEIPKLRGQNPDKHQLTIPSFD